MTDTATSPICSTDTTRPLPARPRPGRRAPYVLDPAVFPDHIDALYRAAWALCASRHDAEDLVQTTFVQVLSRPRIIRNNNERGYLLRALRNTYSSRYRTLARQPAVVPLRDDDAPPAAEPATNARELMQAVATAPRLYRDAVIAVDLLGLSFAEEARSLRTHEKTVATRVYRGRQHIARELIDRGV